MDKDELEMNRWIWWKIVEELRGGVGGKGEDNVLIARGRDEVIDRK
jgi:hypothetical protein